MALTANNKIIKCPSVFQRSVLPAALTMSSHECRNKWSELKPIELCEMVFKRRKLLWNKFRKNFTSIIMAAQRYELWLCHNNIKCWKQHGRMQQLQYRSWQEVSETANSMIFFIAIKSYYFYNSLIAFSLAVNWNWN